MTKRKDTKGGGDGERRQWVTLLCDEKGRLYEVYLLIAGYAAASAIFVPILHRLTRSLILSAVILLVPGLVVNALLALAVSFPPGRLLGLRVYQLAFLAMTVITVFLAFATGMEGLVIAMLVAQGIIPHRLEVFFSGRGQRKGDDG